VAVAVVDVQVNSQGAVNRLREINSASKQAQTGINQLSSAVGGLIKAYAAFQAVKFVFVQTAEIESQTRSLQVLTGSVEQAKQIVKELQALGAATPFTSAELIDAAKRLQAFGIEANKVVDTTRRLADVSGATGAELQGLVTAFGQVQAKGRLQGEELLQFQERGIALQKELQRMYGMSGEEFRQSLEKGRFSAAAVEQAIINLTNAGGKYANGAVAQSDTLQGRLSTLQDSFQRLAQNIGSFFAPVFKFLINRTDELINRLNRGFAGASEEIRQRAAGQRLQRVGVGRTYKDAQGNVYSTITGRLVQAAKTPQTAEASAAPPALLSPTGGTRGGRSAASEAKKLADELKRSLETGDQLGREFSRQTILLASINEQERERFKIQFEYEDRARQIGELKNAEQRVNLAALNDEIRRLDLQRLTTEELKAQNDLFLKRAGLVAQVYGGGAGAFRTDIDLLGQQDKALQSVLDKYPQIGEAASAASQLATQGTMEMINGTKSAQQVFADFLNSIVDILMKSAAQMIAQYIAIGVARMFAGVPSSAATGGAKYGASAFSGAGMGSTGFSLPFLGARANGGSVMAGQPYLVGERGPELFMPGRSGGIAPTGSFGGGANIVVNVDATGSNVQGNGSQGRQLGAAIAAAVQAELVKQKRPGGLLA
jgi:tape measure domain-containing protein